MNLVGIFGVWKGDDGSEGRFHAIMIFMKGLGVVKMGVMLNCCRRLGWWCDQSLCVITWIMLLLWFIWVAILAHLMALGMMVATVICV